MEGEGRGHLLDPSAAEFYPAVEFYAAVEAAGQLSVGHPQIYYRYPPPPPPLPPPPQPVVTVSMFHFQQQLQQVEVVAPAVVVETRAVALSMVPRHVGEAEVRSEMEAFGGVRVVEMDRLLGEGVVTVHFFDLRSAEAAVAEVRDQHARLHAGIGYLGNLPPPSWLGGSGWRGTVAGHPVWAQFAAGVLLDDPNQGSLVVLNSDTSLSLIALRELLEPFGAIKEVKEMASMPQHKLVEFYDTRDAARALSELNAKEINGKRLLLEFSRPDTSSYTSNYPWSSWHGGGGHQNSPLPPRFLQGNPEPSKWTRATGDCSRPSPSPARGGRWKSSQGSAVAQKRTDISVNATTAIVTKSGGSSGGGENKNCSSISSSHPSPSAPSSSKQQLRVGGSTGRRSWKHRSKSSDEARFLFKQVGSEESSESSCRDSRTTVMIKNIPNKYSQKLLLNMLDNHCIQCNAQISQGADEQPYSAYDFVYLPIDFNNKCNVGYGFVNLTSPEAVFRLHKAFHQQPWEVFNSRKICQIAYARLQGLEVLKEHFKNSKFACDNDEYMPVVFAPPRDGKQLTEPVPVAIGRDLDRAASGCTSLADVVPESSEASSTTASTHAPSDIAEGGDDDNDGDDTSGGGDETGAGLTAPELRRRASN